MHAEIIAVGTELTSGAKLDTNSQWLSQRLVEVGCPARYHTSVADDMPANIEVFQTAIRRADVLLITGGLGPTQDDLTRQALAAAAGVELWEDSVSLAAVENYFASRARPMPASNRIQALFPVGAVPIPNHNGTAPGLWMEVAREGRPPCRVAAMPGVPSEMKPMFRDFVQPRLTGGLVIRSAKINCFGLGESHTEERLGDLTRRGHDPDVGITAHDATISLRILAQGKTEAECLAKIETARREIHARLGDYVFGVDEEEPEHVVTRALADRGATLAVCESATGGNLIERLMLTPDGPRVCGGGLVVTGNLQLAELLGRSVTDGPIAAGPQLAEQMAVAVRRRMQSDFALSVTNWGTATLASGQSLPTVWVALAGPDVLHVVEARPLGNSFIFAARTSKLALDLLRRHLAGLPLSR